MRTSSSGSSSGLDLVAELLELVDTRKGDGWADPCCQACYHDPWHRERYGPGPGTRVGDEAWRPAVAKCDCVCHRARAVLGVDDVLNDPRWQPAPGS